MTTLGMVIWTLACMLFGFLVCYIWKFKGYKNKVKTVVGEITYQRIERFKGSHSDSLPMDVEPKKGEKAQ